MEIIFKELKELAASLEEREIKQFINEIIKCKGSIIGIGAGRMGYALQAFVMRLSHLGYNSYMIGDTTLPRISGDDLIIINSSSGETASNALLAKIGKKHNAKIMLLTAGKNSTLAQIADINVFYNSILSDQLMKTAYEQFTFLFFDYCALKLSENGKLSVSEIEINHSVLE